MTGLSVDDLRAGAQRIETLARNCQEVVNHLSEMHGLLERLDLAPEMSADDGRVVLSFDWGLPEAVKAPVMARPMAPPDPMPKPGPVIEFDPEPATAVYTWFGEPPTSPEPEPEPMMESDDFADLDPDPEAVEEPTSEAPNLIKTGPLSEEERDLIVDMASQGVPNSVIAERLNRKTQGVCGAIAGPLRLRIAEKSVQVNAERLPAKAPPPDMKGDDARLFSYLERVGYRDGWTAERDYQLVLILLRGEGIAGAKDKLGADAADCRARWAELNRQPGDLDHQRRLVTVLRKRIELTAAEPA